VTANGQAVAQAAREFVDRHGADAPRVLRERCELSRDARDEPSAEAWSDIADAAEKLLSGET
jgi:hypothetical protein